MNGKKNKSEPEIVSCDVTISIKIRAIDLKKINSFLHPDIRSFEKLDDFLSISLRPIEVTKVYFDSIKQHVEIELVG